RLGKLASSLVELLLKVGCRGAVTARSRCLIAALELRRLGAGHLHCFTACDCPAPLTSGHATTGRPSTAMNSCRFTTQCPVLGTERIALFGRPGGAAVRDFGSTDDRLGSIARITAPQHCCPLHP